MEVKHYSSKFLIFCEFKDASSMQTLMDGCEAHAEVDVFPLWSEDLKLDITTIKERFPHIVALEETWVVFFPTQESIETFAHLLATIDFECPDYIRFVRVNDDPVPAIFNMDQFHRYIFHG